MSELRKTACITGAGKRIGRHLALKLAREGWDIAVHYRNSTKEVETLCNEIVALGQQVIAVRADLENEAEIAALLPAISAQLTAPMLLINNASVFEKDEFQSLKGSVFDHQMAINLKAPLLLSQAFVTELEKNNQVNQIDANIINITDQRIHNLNPDFFSYTLSKVGLSAATTTMAQALAPQIRVNAIAPGPVLQSIHQTKEEFENECNSTLLGAGTSLEDISNAVRFILNTSSMTGETITLDGGQHLKRH